MREYFPLWILGKAFSNWHLKVGRFVLCPQKQLDESKKSEWSGNWYSKLGFIKSSIIDTANLNETPLQYLFLSWKLNYKSFFDHFLGTPINTQEDTPLKLLLNRTLLDSLEFASWSRVPERIPKYLTATKGLVIVNRNAIHGQIGWFRGFCDGYFRRQGQLSPNENLAVQSTETDS